KIRLLEVERDRAENERREAEKQSKIKRLEATLAERDKVGVELQAGITQADRLVRRMIELAEAAGCAWSWNAADLGAGLLSGPALRAALEVEIYRQGASPRLLGGQAEKFEESFPGGRCPRHDLIGLPKQLPALTDALAEASKYASAIMRGTR